MSEMLGNQYFMARKYEEAARELELVYLTDSINKAVRRKLIIAYAQIGNLNRSLELFISLVKEDVGFIINTDPISDDCPCSEIVEQQKNSPKEELSAESNIYYGILWLYCDAKVSLKFLQEALKGYPANEGLKESIEIIKKSIQ